MLFNSYEFIFGFLPLTLVVFFLVGRWSTAGALRWLILASLGFYAYWRPLNVFIIAPSVAINYGLARWIESLLRRSKVPAARAVLIVGIAFNICFLGYFKYANFATGVVNDVFGSHFALAQIVLPLGISFITFQKIAFLVDVFSRRIERFSLQDYALFVLFFPQLIAGPIVHYREMMPQFQKNNCRPSWENLVLGLTLYGAGLFKKVVFADSISQFVSPLYQQSAAGTHLGLLPAWLAAFGFTLQIYFDFSGYTDMALGLARMVGVKLPPNFNSPLKATSIIDFWLRWHLSLTRFLTAYIYNPLALAISRRRAAARKPLLTGNRTPVGAFLALLVLPTLVTMLISGIWHGAGYTFIVWGAIHGLLLVINHLWRRLGRRWWTDRARYDRVMRPVGWVLTFVSVSAAMVVFKATTMHAATSLLAGMTGRNGLGAAAVDPAVLPWLVILSVVAFFFPNSLQVLSHYEPALGVTPPEGQAAPRLRWNPSLAWALGASAVLGACVALMASGGQSEFLYFQF